MDFSRYNVYVNKDGRTRAYDKVTHKVVSYPRVLMAMSLGRELSEIEDVHHKDGNPLNNDIQNLEVITKKAHKVYHASKRTDLFVKRYFDKEIICPVCGKKFIWSAKQQCNYNHKTKRDNQKGKMLRLQPCCSKHCNGVLATSMQYGTIKFQKDELKPKEQECPVCGEKFIWSYKSQRRFALGETSISKPCCSKSCSTKLMHIEKTHATLAQLE